MRLILSLITGIVAGFVVSYDMYNWLVFFIFAPMFWVLNISSYKKRLILSLIFCMSAYAVTLFFIPVSLIQFYPNINFFTVILVFLTVSFFYTLLLIITWSFFYNIRNLFNNLWIILFPAAIAVSEFLNNQIVIFPSYAGISLHVYPRFFNLISYSGIYGATFFIILINAMLGEIILSIIERKKFPLKIVLPVLGFTVLLVIAGMNRYDRLEKSLSDAKSINMLQLQDNLSAKEMTISSKLKNKRIQHFRYWVEETMKYKKGELDLVVWPESSLPYSLNRSQIDRILSNISKYLKTELAIGVGVFNIPGDKLRKKYNAVFYYDDEGNRKAVYEKQKLVPFTEYIPFVNQTPFLKKIFGENPMNLTPGKNPLVVRGKNAKMAFPICYEGIFSDIIRKFKGAEFIINFSNDTWLQNSNGIYLHLLAAGIKAVEFGKPVYMSSYNGISALFEPNGEILYKTKVAQRVSRKIKVRLYSEKTLYDKWGNWFIWCCFGILIIAFLIDKLKKKNF